MLNRMFFRKNYCLPNHNCLSVKVNFIVGELFKNPTDI